MPRNLSEETLIILREVGRTRGIANKGNRWSLEARRRHSSIKKGLKMPFKGKPWSESRRKAQKEPETPRPIVLSGKEYDPDWYEIRKKIYQRDGWTCQECGCKCCNDTKKKIQCHHIDYDISNNAAENLITLCASCHGKSNFNRENWVYYYKLKMEKML